MARKQAPKNYAGGRKVKPGERQAEAHTGRDQNAAHKQNFKAGPVARTLAAGDVTVGPHLDRVGVTKHNVRKSRVHDDGNIGG